MNINDYLDGADKARSDVEQMMGERDCQDGYKCPEDATEDYKRGFQVGAQALAENMTWHLRNLI